MYDRHFHTESHEFGLIIRDGYNVSEAIQVCLNLKDPKTKKREFTGLAEAMMMYGLKHGLIITDDEEGEETFNYQKKAFEIKITPCRKWLLETNVSKS
ncbi:MAG: hypothetical protein ACE365_06615 [Gammaproteobacteria bacterium]